MSIAERIGPSTDLDGNPRPNTLANAHLIAAAPAMYSALELISRLDAGEASRIATAALLAAKGSGD